LRRGTGLFGQGERTKNHCPKDLEEGETGKKKMPEKKQGAPKGKVYRHEKESNDSENVRVPLGRIQEVGGEKLSNV